MEQPKSKYQYLTEEVTLPSKGKLYDEKSPLRKGVLEMKYMTALEEDILTNQNYIQDGTVIDRLIKSLIVTPINYDDLLIGDKNAILIAARILGYGKDYTFNYEGEEYTVDLTEVDDKPLHEVVENATENNFSYTLPTSKIEITFSFMTHGKDIAIGKEIKGLKKLNKKSNPELSTRMKYIITSVNGDSEKKTIREFVDRGLLARDARALRTYINEIQPDSDLTFEREASNGDFETLTIPITATFFWPDVEL
tara:strand:+ start:137 stop:892 length:756 start_codon:yes stop_codon:yes gene_type:complete